MNLTLKNGDLLNLQQEINNLIPGIKSLKLKFYLTDLFEKSSNSLKTFNKLKEELIKEKGEEVEGGGYKLNQFKPGVDQATATEEDLTDEFKDYLELLSQDVDITFASIPVDLFESIETDVNYPTLIKFVKL